MKTKCRKCGTALKDINSQDMGICLRCYAIENSDLDEESEEDVDDVKLIAPQQPQEEKTDNELIAEFMEIEHRPDPFVKSKKLYWHYNELHIMSESLSFHLSWDWLMPVVQKISEYRLAYPEETAKVCDLKIVIKFEALYSRVVECIKFINTQPKQL